MEEPARSRRAILQALTLALVGAAGLWRFLTPRPGSASAGGSVSIPEEDVPLNGAVVLPEEGFAVVRDDSGLHALDLKCTHLGCTVRATHQGFACPCHNSHFDSHGAVLKGPASRPLKRLRVDRHDGVISVRRA